MGIIASSVNCHLKGEFGDLPVGSVSSSRAPGSSIAIVAGNVRAPGTAWGKAGVSHSAGCGGDRAGDGARRAGGHGQIPRV
jgi:hypothetical protein